METRSCRWRVALFAIPILSLGACAGHNHHWQRSGTSAHDTEHAIEACEAASSAGGDVERCMREQGFEWKGHSHSRAPDRNAPALGAISRLPGY